MKWKEFRDIVRVDSSNSNTAEDIPLLLFEIASQSVQFRREIREGNDPMQLLVLGMILRSFAELENIVDSISEVTAERRRCDSNKMNDGIRKSCVSAIREYFSNGKDLEELVEEASSIVGTFFLNYYTLRIADDAMELQKYGPLHK